MIDTIPEKEESLRKFLKKQSGTLIGNRLKIFDGIIIFYYFHKVISGIRI